jgi:hypothetical protein
MSHCKPEKYMHLEPISAQDFSNKKLSKDELKAMKGILCVTRRITFKYPPRRKFKYHFIPDGFNQHPNLSKEL